MILLLYVNNNPFGWWYEGQHDYVLGIIVYKVPYIQHLTCTASFLSSDFFITSARCLDAYKFREYSLQYHNQENKTEVFRTSVYLTMVHPKYDKHIPLTKVNVTMTGCMGLAKFDRRVFRVEKVAVMYPYLDINDTELWTIKKWFKADSVDYRLKYNHMHYVGDCEPGIICAHIIDVYGEEVENLLRFELYGSPFIFYDKLIGVGLEQQIDLNRLECCSIHYFFDWINKEVFGTSLRADFILSLHVSIDSGE